MAVRPFRLNTKLQHSILVLFAVLAVYSSLHAAKATPAAASTVSSFNYRDALIKSLLFLQVQRSGKLPESQKVKWRGDSALLDGHDEDVDLTGGYYDAGDNVKFGFPMAFTMSVLAWGVLENAAGYKSAGVLSEVRAAIRWGTDYLLKASAVPNRLWVQVGDAEADHQCWQRPESMRTPRTAYQINASNPGTEVAAETAAALAAASLVFQSVDTSYSTLLLKRATTVFRFADRHRASNTGECPFYCSYSGYKDELLWAAVWLFKASNQSSYLRYIRKAIRITPSSYFEFNWDNKIAGAAVLLVSRFFGGDKTLKVVKPMADYFMCTNLPGNSLTKIDQTPGGLLYVRPGANTQYVGGAAFLAVVYGDYLMQANQSTIWCNGTSYTPQSMLSFAKSQVDYLLGENPLNMSYMVGFGKAWPTQVHHRGASIPMAYKLTENVGQNVACAEGFHLWYARNVTNPNEAVGAIVGGPDQHDAFHDLRSNSEQLEPTTYINALFTGVLARLQLIMGQ